MLCYAMLCYAMLCYAMLCYAHCLLDTKCPLLLLLLLLRLMDALNPTMVRPPSLDTSSTIRCSPVKALLQALGEALAAPQASHHFVSKHVVADGLLQ